MAMMRASLLHLVTFSVMFVCPTWAFFRQGPSIRPMKAGKLGSSSSTDPSDSDAISHDNVPVQGNGTFAQYIDHSSHETGTFQQRFWYNSQFWGGAGSPVLVFCPGELNAADFTDYLRNTSLPGTVAQRVNGAVVVVEQRFSGESNPFTTFTPEHLQYMTLEQLAADLARITRELRLPFDPEGTSNSPHAPWVYMSGSAPAATGVFVEEYAPGTFWATHASSATVEAIRDYWYFFDTIRQALPRNCTSDLLAIVNYTDSTLEHGTDQEKAHLKAMFRLDDLYDDDFGFAITNPLPAWASTTSRTGHGFIYQLCDAIEGYSDDKSPSTYPPDTGVGLSTALDNYSEWFKADFLQGTCAAFGGYPEWSDPYSTGCFDTHNRTSPIWTDLSPNNPVLPAYIWTLCNEPYFTWQTAAPLGRPSLESRLVTPEYYDRQCHLLFGSDYGGAQDRTVDTTNAKTGGWEYPEKKRMFYTTGSLDPWKDLSVMSSIRPGGPYQGTTDSPAIVIEGARHTEDLIIVENNQALVDAQKIIIDTFVGWIKEFYDTSSHEGSA